MSFWNKKPPENESEEDRKKREATEEQDFLSKIGLAVEQKMKPISDKVASWDDRWKKLEEAATAGDEGGGDAGGGGGDDGLNDDQKRQRDQDINNRKLLALTIATNARITESEIMNEVHNKFPEFESKMKDIFANTAIERKGQADYPIYCRNVMKMLIGEAALAGGLQYDAEKKSFFLEDSNAGGDGEQHDFLAGDMNWIDPHTGKTMSGRQQLARLGIDPKDFAESIKRGVV